MGGLHKVMIVSFVILNFIQSVCPNSRRLKLPRTLQFYIIQYNGLYINYSLAYTGINVIYKTPKINKTKQILSNTTKQSVTGNVKTVIKGKYNMKKDFKEYGQCFIQQKSLLR